VRPEELLGLDEPPPNEPRYGMGVLLLLLSLTLIAAVVLAGAVYLKLHRRLALPQEPRVQANDCLVLPCLACPDGSLLVNQGCTV
jgi:hypothetical protein